MQFTRANPSPRYRELLALYARMHVEGETRLGIPPAQTFPGKSLPPHIVPIKRLIEVTRAESILDYGARKGMQYRPQKIVLDGKHVADGIAEYWDTEVRCFDPGYAPYSILPREKFDGVISTDVLEHCPEEDLPWILDEILGYANAFIYLNVACFPASKTLPSGENAHITVHPPEWWQGLVEPRAARRPEIIWELHAAFRAGAAIDAAVFGNNPLLSTRAPRQ